MSLNFNHVLDSIEPGSGVLTVTATGAITLAAGTTADRPVSPVRGMLRMNIDNSQIEYYTGTEWLSLQSSGNNDALVYAIIF